jgi:hypothetical protein
VLIGGVFVFFWFREERLVTLLWFSSPYLPGVIGTGLAVDPDLRPGDWGLSLCALCIPLTHGFGWQAARVFYRAGHCLCSCQQHSGSFSP